MGIIRCVLKGKEDGLYDLRGQKIEVGKNVMCSLKRGLEFVSLDIAEDYRNIADEVRQVVYSKNGGSVCGQLGGY